MSTDYLSEASLFRRYWNIIHLWKHASSESRAFFGMIKRKWTDISTNMLNMKMKMLKSHPSFHPVRSVWGPDCAIQSIRDLGASIFAGWKIQHLSCVPTRPNFMRQAPGKESSWSWCKMRWSCPRPVCCTAHICNKYPATCQKSLYLSPLLPWHTLSLVRWISFWASLKPDGWHNPNPRASSRYCDSLEAVSPWAGRFVFLECPQHDAKNAGIRWRNSKGPYYQSHYTPPHFRICFISMKKIVYNSPIRIRLIFTVK